ncbi:MAG: protein-S-isoprenylcysteine O-methyltransferase [Actinomycetota bacterium]
MAQRLSRLIGPALFLAITVAIVVRLDSNGWGSIVWLGMAIAMQVIRAPYATRNRDNTIVRQQRQRIEQILLFAMFATSMLIPLLHLVTGVFGFADYSMPTWATVMASIAVVPGLWLFRRSHQDLGRNWSVTTELRDEHTLVSEGVYARVRHPMYTALFALLVLVPVLIPNVIAGFAGLVAFAVLYLIRVSYEEQMMLDQFGADYRAYMGRTGRLLPRFRLPESVAF